MRSEPFRIRGSIAYPSKNCGRHFPSPRENGDASKNSASLNRAILVQERAMTAGPPNDPARAFGLPSMIFPPRATEAVWLLVLLISLFRKMSRSLLSFAKEIAVLQPPLTRRTVSSRLAQNVVV